MLVVRVEIWPEGLQEKAVKVGTAFIARAESLKDGQEVYTYVSRFEAIDDPRDVLPSVRTEHIRRKGFWSLIASALTGALTLKEQRSFKS